MALTFWRESVDSVLSNNYSVIVISSVIGKDLLEYMFKGYRMSGDKLQKKGQSLKRTLRIPIIFMNFSGWN